jgi:hypothetical protein
MDESLKTRRGARIIGSLKTEMKVDDCALEVRGGSGVDAAC